MNKEALFCDGTTEYVIPIEPECNSTVTLRFRTAKDDSVRVRLMTKVGGYDMEKECSRGAFDYYKIDWRLNEEPFSYCFEIQEGDEVCYYNRCGIAGEIVPFYEFRIVPGFSTPDWAKGAVMYQIYPDRFANGDVSNDVKTNEYIYLKQKTEQVTDWNSLPAASDINRFYGGDLQGVRNKLDYLAELGVEVLYFNPLFVSPSNHKYDTQDYWHIDPHFGKIVRESGSVLAADAKTNETASLYVSRTTADENLAASDALFAELIQQAHARGMRVILDGVFNHCGAFHKWLDREGLYKGKLRGAYRHADSPYHDYFYWNADGTYEGWWGYENHPKLNVEGCAALREELLAIARRWVSPPFDADGWRLDVAADLGKTEEFNHAFWRMFRTAVKSVSPDKLILAEHYGDAAPWLTGNQWDSIMNYDAFMEPVTWFLTGVSKHSTEKREDMYNNADVFWGTMSYQMGKLPSQAISVAMNQLSNHDHSRFLTRTNRQIGRVETEGSAAADANVEKAVLREAVLLQMTWNGAPTIYYGDEAGVTGWTDPDNRRTYPWGREDRELIAFHKAAISLRKEYPVLRHGSLKQLYGAYGVLAYGRFDEKEKILVALNNTEEIRTVSIPVWQIGVQAEGTLQNCLMTNRDGFTVFGFSYPVRNGNVLLSLPPKSAMAVREI